MLTHEGAADRIPARVRHRPALGAMTLLVALAGGTLACAGARRIGPAAPLPPPPAVSLDDALSAHERHARAAETVSASGELDVRDLRRGLARSLGVRVVAARGNRLYLKGSVAVVTALEVVSDGRSFWFQVPSKKTVWTGRADGSVARVGADDAPYYSLRPADVTAALLPEPLAPADGEALTLEAEPEVVSLALSSAAPRAPVRRRVWLDRRTLRPVRLRTYDPRGDLVREVELGGWAEGGPRTVRVFRPQEGYEARFRFDRLQVNVSVPDRAFLPRTPDDYTVVEVGG